jgi:hypothetical protein
MELDNAAADARRHCCMDATRLSCRDDQPGSLFCCIILVFIILVFIILVYLIRHHFGGIYVAPHTHPAKGLSV